MPPSVPPNGSRLSCGRRARWRKAAERTGKGRRRGNAIVPYWRAPGSFKRMLGRLPHHEATAAEPPYCEEHHADDLRAYERPASRLIPFGVQ